MASLSRITSNTKIVFKIIGLIIAAFILIQVGLFLKNQLFPAPEPLPTVAFDKLSPIEFPTNTHKENFNFTIDTLTGDLPIFPNKIAIYKIEDIKPDLLAFERAKEMVANLGFKNNGILISEDVYQWEDSSSNKISINIFTSDFIFSSPLLSTTNKESNIDKSQAINAAKNFLQKLSLLPDDVSDEKITTSLFYKENNILIPTTKASEATDIKVDFFQSDIDNLPVYYPHPTTSLINFIVENVNGKAEVVNANYIYQKASKEFATYPLKTAEQAFADLKKGKAYIASYSSGEQNILIKDVFLAYYIGEKRQRYLIPVIIFKGDNDFFAYVSAITDEWIDN